MSNFKIGIIGECMIELAGKPFTLLEQSYGGDTMNTAIYLKRLAREQLKVSYVTVMGQDAMSQAIVDKWWAHGVDIEFVLTDPERHPGIYMIQNDESGERTFQYWRNDSAARYLMQHPRVNEVFLNLHKYDAVYLSGISLAILPAEDRKKLTEYLESLKQLGVKIIFDSNYRPKLWQSKKAAQACFEELYTLSDLALVTLEDEQALWSDADLAACIERFSLYAIPELVVKDGKHGCHYITGEINQHFSTREVENVVDTTAAGDSFNAGYLFAWIEKQTPYHCADLANNIAGKVIQKKGAIVDLGDIEDEVLL